MIPGWPYSVIAALEPGRTSWTLPLDAVRPGPADDATAVTAAQVRQVAERIIAAGHWRDGDPDILVVFDAGYDLTRLAWLLAGLPVEVLGRLRSDRVMYFPAPPRLPGTNGRPLRHGAAFKLAGERSWPAPAVATVTQTTRDGTARAAAWGRLHQQLASRAGWEDHDGELRPRWSRSARRSCSRCRGSSKSSSPGPASGPGTLAASGCSRPPRPPRSATAGQARARDSGCGRGTRCLAASSQAAPSSCPPPGSPGRPAVGPVRITLA